MQTAGNFDSIQGRAAAIIDILLYREYVTVGELAAHLRVSEATIRRDLTALDQQGLLKRTSGGAMHRRELTEELRLFYEKRQTMFLAEKQRIGLAAAQHIAAGETIAFTSGSTPLQIAQQIDDQLRFTAISNDLSIVQSLATHPQVDIFVPGGFLRLGHYGLIGPTAVTALRSIAIDKVFLTVTGLDARLGATAGHIINVIYLRELIARARQCIVVADHSKFENPPQIAICGWDKIHTVITDSGIAQRHRQVVEAKTVELVIV